MDKVIYHAMQGVVNAAIPETSYNGALYMLVITALIAIMIMLWLIVSAIDEYLEERERETEYRIRDREARRHGRVDRGIDVVDYCNCAEDEDV